MCELISQMGAIHGRVSVSVKIVTPASAILEIDRNVADTFSKLRFSNAELWSPLAGSLIQWIDKTPENDQSKEEWKGCVETNKILGSAPDTVPVVSICVRIGAMRCHSQALTIKLKKNVPLDEITEILDTANPWSRVIPNQREASMQELTPTAVTGGLVCPVGRLRKLKLDESGNSDNPAAFTVGDQLLWGAAEPLRRMLRILLS